MISLIKCVGSFGGEEIAKIKIILSCVCWVHVSFSQTRKDPNY